MASSTAKDHLPAPTHAQQGPAFASSSSAASQAPEDESRKKNTDCVYFLASPLTCKKGSECDYRHSEYARMNPRDCYYWLNGKCLNLKCSFRHPPLDTPLGNPADTSAGSSIPVSSSAAFGSLLPQSHTAKPTAPCIYFQSGYCMKGDRCPFSHGQHPSNYKAPEFPTANLSESSRFNTASGGLQKCSQLKIAPQPNVSKPIQAAPPQPNTTVHAVTAVTKNGAFAAKSAMPQHMLHDVPNNDFHKHNETILPSFNNGGSKNKSNIASQASSRDDRDQRESSPGYDFDVLVHDEGGDADYYGNDDQFPGIQGHEGRDHNEFENGRSDRYKSLDDPLVFHDRHGYDIFNPVQERHLRDSSERPIFEDSHYDQRAYKGSNPDGTRNSDLRQRLSKQRRTNGLSSVVNTDREEHRYRSSRRDSRHSPPRGSSISSRLQGRIKLPGQASAVNPPSLRSERETRRDSHHSPPRSERNHSRRLSPSRPSLQSHRGRLQDRLKPKVQDDIVRDPIPRRDFLDYNNPNFVAPKSLAELKKGKQNKSEDFTPISSRQNVSFEPPKPLSEILKRKRKAEDNNDEEIAAVEKQPANKENKPVEDNLDFEEKTKTTTETEIAEVNNVSEGEEGLITDGVEGNELEEEYYEEEGEEGVYEEGEDAGEGYNLDEGENGELQDEYMDEDEDDSFAKKIGVMFS